MAKLKFHALKPGRYVVGKDDDGNKIYREFTKEDCQRYYQAGKEMLANRLEVPLSWGHRSDAKPGVLSQDDIRSKKVLGFAGWLDSWELDRNHELFLVGDIPDPEDYKKAKNMKFCSPGIEHFIDGYDHNWGECITHLAITPRPKQHLQQPVIALGYPIWLSIDPYEGIDMAETEDKPPKKKDDTTGDGSAGHFDKVIELLAKKGIILPDDTTADNAWERLSVALLQHVDDEEEETPPITSADTSTDAPLMMAHEKRVKELKEVDLNLIQKRIERLFTSGRVNRPIKEGMLKELTPTLLAYDDKFNLKTNTLLTKIEAYEQNSEGLYWSPHARRQPTNLSHGVEEVDIPNDIANGIAPVSKEDVAQFNKDADAMTGKNRK